MPHGEGLPQTGDAQEIGQDAIDCLRANRPTAWRLTELAGDNDFGFDFQVQIAIGQQVVHPFRLQLKGTRSPKSSADHSYFAISLSVSTLRYFDNTDEPVLLVYCDLSVDLAEPRNGVLYYVWVREELERIKIESIPLEQKEAILHVPTTNTLNRSTDLLEEVRKRYRLSRVGHTLETSVAGMDPSMAEEDRVVMVEAITKSIGSRNLVFAQALAEPATEIWVNPPQGSLAWLLTEAKTAIAAGKVDRCNALLQEAEEKLADATNVERAEYWHLTGKTRLALGNDSTASQAFMKAALVQPRAKYWAAWAEIELRRRYRPDWSADFSDVLATLPDIPDPMLLAIKARLLAGSRRYDDAMALLDTFTGIESLAARAVVQTMYFKPVEALHACIQGLALEGNREGTRLLFLILRARARFSIALRRAEPLGAPDEVLDDEIIHPSGPLSTDATALRLAWSDIEDAVAALEEIRWVSNAEFVADIWIAAAAMLGKQKQILGRVLAAARARPDQPDLQAAAEAIAAQCGDFQAALEANSRVPEGDMKYLRRIMFLHELGKHRDCVDLMLTRLNGSNRSHQLFAPSVVLAVLSADALAKTELVENWCSLLSNGGPEHQAQAAVLDYLLAQRRSESGGEAALSELVRMDELLGHPNPTSQLLFQELDPESRLHAEQLLTVAARLRASIRLSPMVAARIGVAMVTLKRWDELLSLCKEAESEFDLVPRIRAFHALALDQLGRSDEASAILESMLNDGNDDGVALNTYVNIMVRWGFMEKARAAAELILERAQTREHRMECIRMLFNLEQHSNPASSSLASLAFKIGELARKNDEIEEGGFLSMVLSMTSIGGVALNNAQNIEFQARVSSFFERFPHSRVIRRFELPTKSGVDEIMRSLNSAIGLTEEREQNRAQLEAQLRSGGYSMPFAWRPRFALANVQDTAHLWHHAKQSAVDDKQFHLNMIGQLRSLQTEADLQSKIPLLDLITLFVLYDLDLVDLLFQFFPKVAVGQETLAELLKMTQIFAGSVFREKCVEVQSAFRPYMAQILQPHGGPPEKEENVPRSSREIKKLMGFDNFVLYSDDAIFRTWALGRVMESRGMCTLDLLSVLEETGRLSCEHVAQKLATLCDWNVGVQIQLRHQIVLIGDEIRNAQNITVGIGLLGTDPRFMSIANSVWNARTNVGDSLRYIGSATCEMVQDSHMTDVAVGSFIGIWLLKIGSRPEKSLSSLDLACHVIVFSIVLKELPIAVVKRLWSVYLGLVASIDERSEKKYSALATERLAETAAHIESTIFRMPDPLRSTIGERLMLGLDGGSQIWLVFCAAYQKSLVKFSLIY